MPRSILVFSALVVTAAAFSLVLISCGSQSSSGTGAVQSSSSPAATNPQIVPPPQAANYTLAWSDSFATLDLSPNSAGAFSWYPGIWWEPIPSPFGAAVNNSALTLTWSAGQNPPDTTVSSCAPNAYSCHSFRYGYFEARMKWDVTTGAWPAFWMLPTQAFAGASETGELDIFEGQGDPADSHTYFGTIHDWMTVNGRATDVANNNGSNYKVLAGVDFTQWHTYGVLWVKGSVTWYFDDEPILTAATYPIFDQQNYFLLLGAQEGANWTYGNTQGVNVNSMNLSVNWVRVWQP